MAGRGEGGDTTRLGLSRRVDDECWRGVWRGDVVGLQKGNWCSSFLTLVKVSRFSSNLLVSSGRTVRLLDTVGAAVP